MKLLRWFLMATVCFTITSTIALDFEALLEQTSVAKECTGDYAMMVGSSCFTFHMDEQKKFPEAFNDCRARGQNLAHFYTKNIWNTLKSLIPAHILDLLQNDGYAPWIGLKRKVNGNTSESTYHWLKTSLDDLMETSYADQDEVGGRNAKLNYAYGKAKFIDDRLASGGGSAVKTSLCQKAVPMQKYTLIAENKKSINSVSNLTNLEINNPWFCGFKCLNEDGCVGYNYWPSNGGGCEFLVKLSDVSELALAPGHNYYERHNRI